MSEHIIDINGLVKHFGDNAVIDGISLSVSKGEVVVRSGPGTDRSFGVRKEHAAAMSERA